MQCSRVADGLGVDVCGAVWYNNIEGCKKMKNIQAFIQATELQSKNSAKVAKFVFKKVNEDIVTYDTTKLKDLILQMQPNSHKDIVTFCWGFGAYAKWLYEQNIVGSNGLYEEVQKIDKNELWELAKPNARRKFISNECYHLIIEGIESYEEYNSLYYKTLFSCIYEGIYNDDLSVIKNLRLSDIEDNIVTLHEDSGYSYKLKISNQLSFDLKQLATIDYWERPNRYGLCQIETRGIYSDSIFKIENRSTASDDSFRFSLYAKLRKIAKSYVGYQLLPLQLYISGLMHRIGYLLQKNNLTVYGAFADNSRNSLAHSLVSAELLRCNNNIKYSNFRDIVKGHIDVFDNDIFDDLNDGLFEELFYEIISDDMQEFEEGEENLIEHLMHERNIEVVKLAKLKFKEKHSGKLFCENCGFDFSVKYGERGIDFIEAHHINPVSEMTNGGKTRVEDLVMLCSNCHSIIHLKRPWLTVYGLKKITNI